MGDQQEDPATARKGEVLYVFLCRSIIYSYISAWRLETKRLKDRNKRFLSFDNEMIRFSIFQLFFCGAIYFLLGSIIYVQYLVFELNKDLAQN